MLHQFDYTGSAGDSCPAPSQFLTSNFGPHFFFACVFAYVWSYVLYVIYKDVGMFMSVFLLLLYMLAFK